MKKNRLKILLLLLLIAACIILFFPKRTKIPEPRRHPPVISVIPEQIINEGENFEVIKLTDYVSDFDESSKYLKWSFTGNKYLKVKIDSMNHLKAQPPNKDWFGKDTILITAVDAYGLTANSYIAFRVNPVNDPPVISYIPSQIIDEGMEFEVINLNDFVNDIDNVKNDLKWIFRGNEELKIKIDPDNKVRIIIPNKDWFGKERIEFTVRDRGGLSSTFSSEFIVKPINDPPIIEQIPSQEINEGEKFKIINLNDFVRDVDNEINDINWSISGNNELQVSIDENNRALVSTPNGDWNGSERIIFTATDPFGLSAEAIVEFRVNPVNDPPMILQIPSKVIKQQEYFQKINLNEYVEDIDDEINSLKWSVKTSGSFNVSIDEKNIAKIELKDENWFGQDTVVFVVSDIGGLKASKSVVFEVKEVKFYDRYPISPFKNLLVTGLNDVIKLTLSPFKWNQQDILKGVFVVGGTTLFMTVDKSIQKKVEREGNYSNSALMNFGEFYGRGITSQITALTFFSAGLAFNQSDFVQIGLEIFESYLIANNLHLLLKRALGRARPYTGNGPFDFDFWSSRKANENALPSGHAILSFSLSSVIAAHVENFWLKTLIFTPAFVTAFSRIYQNQHWTSDVFLGGMLGYVIGDFLVSSHYKSSDKISFGVNQLGQFGLFYRF